VKHKRKDTLSVNRLETLRRRAENTLLARSRSKRAVNENDPVRLLHELEIHQVELKLQNEELHRAHMELWGSHDRYTDLYQFAPVAYVTLDQGGMILESNLMASEVLGVERRELESAYLRKFILSETRDAWHQHLRDAFSNDTKQMCEIRICRADGALLSIRAESIGIGHGEERHCLVALIDITERKRVENEREQLLARERTIRRELEAATKTKDRFLSMVSHELRTPLTPLLGWLSLMRDKTAKNLNVDYVLECMERSAKTQAKLVDDLLDVSEGLTGKLLLKFKQVDVPAIIHAAVDSVRSTADAKHINIQTQLEKDASLAAADAERLQQVIWNLLSNAIKFTPSGGKVDVQLRRTASDIEIIVSDTGQGIPGGYLPYVFDPFSQAGTARMRSQNGLGLGLAIARNIVEMHGGTIGVKSTEGKGTTFTIRLPLITRCGVPTVDPVSSPVVPDSGQR
jgi:PAS domain S-box-containing protein